MSFLILILPLPPNCLKKWRNGFLVIRAKWDWDTAIAKIFLGIAILSVSTRSFAECIDYTDYYHRAGGVKTEGISSNIYLVDGYAYLPSMHDGLRIYDVRDIQDPRLIGTASTGITKDVCVSGSYAYTINSYNPWKMTVVDVSDPSLPIVVNMIEGPGLAAGIETQGDFVYLLAGDLGFSAFDISSPEEPVLVGSINIDNINTHPFISGSVAFLVAGHELLSVNISDPSNLQIMGTVGGIVGPEDIWVKGDYAYVPCGPGSGLRVVDVSDPYHMIYLGNDATITNREIFIEDETAYLSGGTWGVQVVDVSGPGSVSLISNLAFPRATYRHFVLNEYAYFCGLADFGVQIFDVSRPESPPLLGEFDFPGSCQSMFYDEGYLFFGDTQGNFTVVNVAVPDEPTLEISVDITFGIYDVFVDDSFAYLARRSKASIVDVSDPANPQVVWDSAPGDVSYAVGVFADGNWLYVADRDLGFRVFNMADPLNIVLWGQMDTPGIAVDVIVDGDIGFIAGSESGIQIVNLVDRTSPVIVGSFDTPGSATNIEYSNDYIYVADGTGGTLIIDVSQPTNPQLVGELELRGIAKTISLKGGLMYVGVEKINDNFSPSHIEVVNISNPENPVPMGLGAVVSHPYNTAYINGIIATEHCVYVSRGDLWVYPAQCSVPSLVLSEDHSAVSYLFDAYPNPFNPRTTITFDLPKQTYVSLQVFDMAGRLVKDLITAEPHTLGRHEVVWNGRDNTGRQVASGTYFYRLVAGSYSETKRMALIK